MALTYGDPADNFDKTFVDAVDTAYGGLTSFDWLPEIPTGPKRVQVGLTDTVINDRNLELSPQELSLIRCLANRPDQVVTRGHMIGCAWGGQALPDDTRTVDVHIRRLRTKLQIPGLISTIRGQGYRLNTSLIDLTFVPLED